MHVLRRPGAHLLTSKEPPLDSEVPLVRDIISDSQNRIGPLNAHIEALQVQIINLETTLAQFVPRWEETRARAAASIHRLSRPPW
jgi:hypothetical protein